MTAWASVTGRLAADPEQRTTRNGAPWATGRLAVSSDDPDGPTLWIKVVAFGRAGRDLAAHRRGDPVSIAGRLQLQEWTGRDGEARQTLECKADAMIGPRNAPPAPKPKAQPQPAPLLANADRLLDDDDLPF